jgi:hypothetical protein
MDMINITLEGKEYQLDIEQAEKLGLLKEKDSRVKSWEEFKEKYENIEGYIYATVSDCILTINSPINTPIQITPHEAKALAAFSKLLKLRRDWIGEWEPDWENMNTSYGVIWANKNKVQANTACTLTRSLSFPDYKTAKEFLETFHDLIEEAKILI